MTDLDAVLEPPHEVDEHDQWLKSIPADSPALSEAQRGKLDAEWLAYWEKRLGEPLRLGHVEMLAGDIPDDPSEEKKWFAWWEDFLGPDEFEAWKKREGFGEEPPWG